MAVRKRRSVLAIGHEGPEIIWYRKAVKKLKTKPANDPTSWSYMASIHGNPTIPPFPAGTRGYWGECQHQTWFFLPWHRGYLAAFEAVVARTVKDLGGPADWALPYWDYTAPATGNPNPQLMPQSFFSRTIPGTTQFNDLWSPRRNVANGNFGLSGPIVSLAAMNLPRFVGSAVGVNPGFGGPATLWNHGGGQNGGIENVPHNVVHGQIGGLMGDPDTAALDPIFWLHHCNIDRLWEVYRRRWANADPVDPRWRSAVPFGMHNGQGQAFTFTSGQMLDTATVLHGYVYDNVPHVVPVAPPAAGPLDDIGPLADEPEDMARLIGANDGSVDISGPAASSTVDVEAAPAIGPLADEGEGRIWLRLENITGTGMPGNYNVYVDFPDDDRERAWIGLLSTFGIERASRDDDSHPGGGLSTAFEITELAGEMGINEGNLSKLKVDVERINEPETFEDLPGPLDDVAPALNRPVSARIGRIGLYVE